MIEPQFGSSAKTETCAGASGVASPCALDLDRLQPGQRWRDRYDVGDQLPDITYGKVLRARDCADGADVLIRSFRVTDHRRAQAWDRLARNGGEHLIGLVEALEADGRRLEVTRSPAGRPFRTWAAARTWNVAQVRDLTAQLHQIVSALHAAGVAHLNLNPGTLSVSENEPFRLIAGGLEAAVDITSPGLIATSVDPFYAPPEAAGLFQQPCGTNLKAWDWWSVGRVVQEAILGRHVLGLVLDRDVTRRTPELLARADQFLREGSGGTCRPGGVELMNGLEAPVPLLLRGLLTSCRDARWTTNDVAAWVRGETVRERYHLATNERLFVWKEQAFTVEEAAVFFSQPDQWKNGAAQVLDATTPGTLAHFLAQDGSTRKLLYRIEDLARLPETSALANLSADAAREIVAAVALTSLANGAAPFRVRGRPVDRPCLVGLLEPSAQPDGLALVEVLLERTIMQHVAQTTDAEAARLLNEMEHHAAAALSLATRNHWFSRADRSRFAHLLSLLLKPTEWLQEEIAKGRTTFARSRDESLNELFLKSDLTHAEAAVVVLTLGQANKHQFISHETWVAEQDALLRDRAEKLATAATWKYLARALKTGPHLVGPLFLFLVYWSAVAACIALAIPSRVTLASAISLAVAGCALRLIVMARARRDLQARLAGATPLKRLPTMSQCADAVRRVLPHDGPLSLRQIEKEFGDIRKKIAALPGARDRGALVHADRFMALHVVSALSVVATLAVLGSLGYKLYRQPPTWPVLEAAWFHPQPDPAEEEKKTKERAALEAKRAQERAANVDALAKISWPFRKPQDAQHPRISELVDATKAQAETAAKEAERALAQYERKTIVGLVAVQVDVPSGYGFMLYDGKAVKLADKRVYVLPYVPLARAWIMLGEEMAIYLGER